MQHKHYRFDKSKLAYSVWGEGEEVMLLFHGFGQSRTLFFDIPEVLVTRYKFIAVDLFGHGDSSFFHAKILTPDEWKPFIEGILNQEGVTHRFSVLGFSLGGRVAINTAFVFSDRVEQLVLLAPDGIVESAIYVLATRNRLFKKLFKQFVFSPWIYQKAISLVYKAGLLEPSLAEFFLRVMERKSRRFKLYRIWNIHSGMHIPFVKVVSELEKCPTVYLAKGDRLVKNKQVKKLCKKKNVPLEELKTGHFQIVTDYFLLRAEFFSRGKQRF